MLYKCTKLSPLHLGWVDKKRTPRIRQTSGNSKIETIQRREEVFRHMRGAPHQLSAGRRWWHRGQSSSSRLHLQGFKSGHQLPPALCPCPDYASILIYKTGLRFPPHMVVVMIKWNYLEFYLAYSMCSTYFTYHYYFFVLVGLRWTMCFHHYE